MKKILVLLSTYNGEKYIQEQIDSLLNQKNIEVDILVRDDGSQDRTIAILENYSKENSNVILVKGENCGARRSFFQLMKQALSLDNYDYYCFSDQDDVWYDDKLNSAVFFLENFDSQKPSLYLGAYQMVSASLLPLNTPSMSPVLSLPAAFSANCATGCTMVFNRKLLEIAYISSSDDVIMHDYWMYLVCLAIGGNVYYDKVPHIYYRQHDNNVIGGIKDPFIKRWKVRVGKLFMKGDCYKSKVACKLLLIPDIIRLMSESDRNFLKSVSTCRNICSKIQILRKRDFWHNSLDKNVQNLGLIITGKF